jgi:hypothetical protein
MDPSSGAPAHDWPKRENEQRIDVLGGHHNMCASKAAYPGVAAICLPILPTG